MMRISGRVMLAFLGFAVPLHAQDEGQKRLEQVDVARIPALGRTIALNLQNVSMNTALQTIARKAALRLTYSREILPENHRVSLTADQIEVDAALRAVLHDAGLDILALSSGQVVVVRKAKVDALAQGGSVTGRVTDARTGNALIGVEVSLEGARWRGMTDAEGRYRLADVAPGSYTVLTRRIGYGPERRSLTVTGGQETTVNVALQPAPTTLGDIVVTAQKREERLIEVPQAVTILSADNLARSGVLQFRDFANTVPGLTFMTQGAGLTQVTLRGITVGRDIGQTVAVYVDEVPYGASTEAATGGLYALDVGLFDMERIEVLRGPQGTLYGASTMGGLLKYVTKRPDATRFGIAAQTGASGTRGGGASYYGAAVVNAPIVTGKAALRGSGFYSRDGGYIDNLALGQINVNRSDVAGGRADLLLTPNDALSVRITGFLQNIDRDGQGTADYAFTGVPLDGSLSQRRPFAEPFAHRFRLASGTVTYDLDWASLISISSYQTVRSPVNFDATGLFMPILTSIGLGPFGGVGILNEKATDKFVQEVRLTSQGTQTLEWVIGGFYTHESSDVVAAIPARTVDGQPAPIDLFTSSTPSSYEEHTVFGDLTWHLTRAFNVTGGVRYARNHQRQENIGSGLFGASRGAIRSTDDVFTYLANARYRFSNHATGYLRYATGYKSGGPNYPAFDFTTGLPVQPPPYEPDRLRSYEAGFKAESSDGRFGIDVAGYYIDWSNIQVVTANLGSIANASGGATVQGAELALTAHPISRFTATGAFAYQDAEMSEAEPSLGSVKGERLPNVPRFTAALNADYELSAGRLQPTVGATLRYVSNRTATFNNTTNLQHQYQLPEYTTVDLRAGFTLRQVYLQLYVRNLFDGRGQISAFNWQSPGVAQPAILQPRTIGLSASTANLF